MAASPKRSDTEITPLHMKVLCDKLKEMYDYVIIDAPPLGSVIDAAIVARHCDASVLVVAAVHHQL